MWSDEAIRKITSLQFPDFENMNWERRNSDKPHRGYFGGCLRHGTYTNNIESILRNGLDVFHDSVSYRSNNFLWATNPLEYKNGIEDITHSYGGEQHNIHCSKRYSGGASKQYGLYHFWKDTCRKYCECGYSPI